ncbi:ABCG15 [Symbiodinium sp. CCMP2456]|nr:ABCG15 [Symbiodinium sp. CCMP2456]
MPDQPADSSNRIEEIRETNAWFLDSVFFYGDRFYQFARRLIDALSRLHQAVRDGQLPPTAARRAAAFIIACSRLDTAAEALRVEGNAKAPGTNPPAMPSSATPCDGRPGGGMCIRPVEPGQAMAAIVGRSTANAHGDSADCETMPVPVKGARKGDGPRKILSNVTCEFPPGRLSAIMGASGSGKTSVLTAIRGLQAADSEMCGQVLCDGHPVKMDTMRHLASAVPQEDVFLAALTPRETLGFAAELRLPTTWGPEARTKRVEEVIKLLNIEKCADTAIGDEKMGLRGISGGERRRLSVGLAIIGGLPEVLLCDEPTSGLDSAAATNIVALMKALAGRGVTVLAAIHQPSYAIFSEFDYLLLLEVGVVVYSGEVAKAEAYFAKHGAPTPEKTNPAHHFVQIVQDESSKWIETWQKAAPAQKPISATDSLPGKAADMPSMWQQTCILTRRTLLENFKNKKKLVAQFDATPPWEEFAAEIMSRVPPSIMIGCIFYQMGAEFTQKNIFPIKGVMFLCASLILRRGLRPAAEVVDCGTKGQGVLAAQDIRPGEVLSCEKPLMRLTVNGHDSSWYDDAKEQFQRSKEDLQRRIFSLADTFSEGPKTLLGILRTNLFSADESDDVLLCETASRFNHSCNANCEQIWNQETLRMEVRSCTYIQAGQELCVRYIDIRGAMSYRQYLLKKMFGFDCACEVCARGADDDSDSRRSEMACLSDVLDHVEPGQEEVSTSTLLRRVRRLLDLYDEEGLHDQSSRLLAYEAAAALEDYRGKIAGSHRWLQRALRCSEMIRGSEHPATRELRAREVRTQALVCGSEREQKDLQQNPLIESFYAGAATFQQTKGLLKREYYDGVYQVLPYYMAYYTGFLAMQVPWTLAWATPLYLLIGLPLDAYRFGVFVLTTFLVLLFACVAGSAVGAKTRDADGNRAVLMPLIIPATLFSGYVIPFDQIPRIWLPFYYMSPIMWAMSIFETSLYEGVVFEDCNPNMPMWRRRCWATGDEYLEHATCEVAQKLGVPGMLAVCTAYLIVGLLLNVRMIHRAVLDGHV